MVQVNIDYPGFVFDTPVFNASDFGATLSLTWIVQAGDVTTFRYGIFGRMMVLWLVIVASTFGGSETGASLTLKIPGGRLVARTFDDVMRWTGPFGIDQLVRVSGVAGSNLLTIRNFGTSDFVLGTDSEGISGTLTFEVQ